MKNWQVALIVVFSLGLGVTGWFHNYRAGETAKRETLVAASGTEKSGNKPNKKSVTRIADVKSTAVPVKPSVLGDVKVDADGWVIEEDDLSVLSDSVRALYAEFLKTRSGFDNRATLAFIDKLLARQAKGEILPRFVKQNILSSLKGMGLDALDNIIGLMADVDFDVANDAAEALKSILWDFDATPRQIADTLKGVMSMTTSQDVLDPFIQEMSDWPTDIKVETALSILDSKNAAAIEIFEGQKQFIFGDFDGKINTREDIVALGEEAAAQAAEDAANESSTEQAQNKENAK